MFYIPLDKYKKIENTHFSNLETIIKDAIENEKTKISDDNYLRILDIMSDELSKFYFKNFIISEPEVLFELYLALKKEYNFIENDISVFSDDGVKSESLVKVFENVFCYKSFSLKKDDTKNWAAYALCNELQVNVCPYCNRQYTFTVTTEKDESKGVEDKAYVRPELDHYFPKSKYPMFGLSLYNLIPSCHICNSTLKGVHVLSLEKYLHPLIKHEPNFKFSCSGSKAGDKYKDIEIILVDKNGNPLDLSSKESLTCKFFAIYEIYSFHTKEVEDLLNKTLDYPTSYIRELVKISQKSKRPLTEREVFNSIFNPIGEGTEIDIPLGKFRKDIIEEIKSKEYNTLQL